MSCNGYCFLSMMIRLDTSVEINTVEAKKRGKQCQRLYVKGLPTDSNEKDLIDFFQSLGHLNLKIFPRDRNTGLLRNFCYLTYDSEEVVFIFFTFLLD